MPKHRAATLFVILLLLAGLPAAGQKKGSQKEQAKHYGLIFGTAYGPDDRALYGARVEIHPAGKKHPSWEMLSDHRGEFAQRVPPGPGDYVVTGHAEIVDPQTHKKKRFKAEAKVHIEQEERQDVSLHLTQ